MLNYVDLSHEIVCFFFSSRRRHTRFDCDWSSDVCSSDLIAYVRNTTSADRAIHPGRGASDTCSERNSPQFLTIAPQTIRATTLATASCRAHQSHLRTVGTAVLRRDLAVQGLEALRDDGGGEAPSQGGPRPPPPAPRPRG